LIQHKFFDQDPEHDNREVKFQKSFSDLISELNTQRQKTNSRPTF